MNRDHRSPIVVIPGYMGSTLRDLDSGRKRWGGLALLWTDYRSMRVEPDRERRESAAPKLRAEKPVWPMYPGLVRRLRRGGRRVLVFPWDWRRSLRDMAALFGNFVRERCGDEPIDLVGHSLGGLIATLWCAGPGKDRLHRFVAIALPVDGAEKAVTVLRDGDENFARFNLRTPKELMRRLAWDCPSIYEALPPREQIWRREAWPADSGIRDDLLQQARDTRREFDSALHDLAARGSAQVLLIGGSGERTDVWSFDAEGRLVQGAPVDGDGWLRADGVKLPGLETWSFRRGKGDNITLGLHYPGAILLGSHPLLPMFRRVQERTAEFLTCV
jgi:pimeloyl-ACP methyl ester carboxylesterase